MDTKGRKLLRYAAGIMAAIVLMGSAYTTTAMASGIGLIDTADLLDIHAEANDSSEVVGQVMDEGHVAILGRAEGWVQIQAGDIIGWVPQANLIETEVSNEEAYEANQEIIAEITEEIEEIQNTEDVQEENADTQTVGEETAEMQDSAAAVPEMAEEFAEERLRSQKEDEGSAAKAQEQAAAEEARRLAQEQAKAVEEAQRLAQEQAAAEEAQRLAQEQAKAVEEAQRLAQEQAKAVEEAQRLAQEQAKAVEEAQRLAQEQAKAVEEAQRLAQEQAAANSQSTLAAVGVSEEELKLLASIIYCEANGEPYIGKVAVGNVVMNRVRSSRYPNTIKDVIYARGQFSPVRNGSMSRALKNNSADASCYQAALEALAGSSPVGDKLYFRRVNGRSGQVIGHHVFY